MEQDVMTDARVSLVVPRLDAKIWGGRRLERYGLDLPDGELIGEALVTAGEAVVSAGNGVGKTLQDLVNEDPAARLGARAQAAVGGRAMFPLLAKLLDAAENLSIQVHPDDEGARSLDRLGKTEAWHVLDVEPGGKLYIGLRDDVTLDAFMEDARLLDGTSAGDIRAVDPVAGKTVLLAPGTIHALGAGVMVYEIQQPSDVTFRLDDWGRVDAQGNPREMHLEQGEAASREEMRPEWIEPIVLDHGRMLLTACRYFALEKLSLSPGSTVSLVNDQSPQVVTLLSGSASISGGGDQVHLTPGSSGVIWPSSEPATLVAGEESVLLRAWVPDLLSDVVEPARAAGATDAQIVALGGMTADLAGVVS
jgi:mannose-6-phosphate isomerase